MSLALDQWLQKVGLFYDYFRDSHLWGGETRMKKTDIGKEVAVTHLGQEWGYCWVAGFPGRSAGKEPISNAGDLGSSPVLGRSPGGGHGNPLHYSCLENPHGQRSLAGYSPLGHKEVDTTE